MKNYNKFKLIIVILIQRKYIQKREVQFKVPNSPSSVPLLLRTSVYSLHPFDSGVCALLPLNSLLVPKHELVEAERDLLLYSICLVSILIGSTSTGVVQRTDEGDFFIGTKHFLHLSLHRNVSGGVLSLDFVIPDVQGIVFDYEKRGEGNMVAQGL